MEVIFHIGYPKTGTSSIQMFLFANRNKLKELGIVYPEIGIEEKSKAHHYLAQQFKPGTDAKEILYEIIDIYKDSGKKVLLSSEYLIVFQNLLFLKEVLPIFVFPNFIIYIRRQDVFIESMFSQDVKFGGFKQSFGYYCDLKKTVFQLDYLNYVNSLKDLFPDSNVTLRIYDRRLFPEGNVILDFLSILGIDMPEAKEYKIEANPSLSHISTLALRKINEEFSLPHEERVKVIRYLLNLDREEGPGPLKTFFTLEERIEFLERFRESNEKLFREWFNSENKFVLSPEEIEFYREQDKIPREEIERLVEERYQKVVENVIKKIEAKPKIYISVKKNKLVKEENIVEKVVIDQMYLDLLKDSKLVIGGVVVLKPDVKEEYKLLIEDAEGTKEVKWNIPSPGYAKMYPENPHAKNPRFKVNGIITTEDKPVRLYLQKTVIKY